MYYQKARFTTITKKIKPQSCTFSYTKPKMISYISNNSFMGKTEHFSNAYIGMRSVFSLTNKHNIEIYKYIYSKCFINSHKQMHINVKFISM